MVPPKRGFSESSLTSVADMIDDVFRNDTENIVDFGFLHAILLILTRSLCLLDRKVTVDIKHAQTHQNVLQNSNKIAVGEIKVTTESAKNGQRGEESRVKGTNGTRDEKILLVERRTSTENSTTSLGARYALDQTPQSLVTREQYISLEAAVKKLQKRFDFTGPELMGGFYQTASLSDPLAVIQLSARLEAVERAIDNTMKALKKFPSVGNDLPSTSYSLPNTSTGNAPASNYNITANATNLPSTGNYLHATANTLSSTGYSLPATVKHLNDNYLPISKSNTEGVIKTMLEESVKKNFSVLMDIKVLGPSEAEYLRVPSYKSMHSKDSKDSKTSKLLIRKKTDAFSIFVSEFETEQREEISNSTPKTKKLALSSIKSINLDEFSAPPPTMEEFRCIMKRFGDDMAKLTQKCFHPISQKTISAKQNVTLCSDRLKIILDNLSTINQLENKVKQFVDGAVQLDSKLNKKTSRIYEELTEIDVAIENMSEALAKPLPENEAIPELACNMNALLLDFNRTSDIQEELFDIQESLGRRLKVLKKHISDVELVKANRDELDEALESKINLSTLNGIMSMEYFNAVLGKLQKHINDLFHHFNRREISWQKRIDYFWSLLEVKAKKSDVIALKDDILKNITKLDDYLDLMISICTEHSIKKREQIYHRGIILNRPCISCDRDPDEKFKSKAKMSKKRKQHTEDNNKNKICRLNNPIPHTIHPGSKCVKLCVSPNKLDNKISEDLASSIIVQSSKRSVTLKVANEIDTIACEPCNTSEKKNIILKHNLKFIEHEHEQPKNELSVPKKTSIEQETEKSKDSITSIQRRRWKHDSSHRSISINYSNPQLPDSDSQYSDAKTIFVLDLEDELSTYV